MGARKFNDKRRHDLDYDEVFFEVGDKWDKKAKQLQKRRWRKMRQHEKTNGPIVLSKQIQGV